ncbi:hypothetical protein PMY38_15640 [Clostridium tertium]|jgi:hypothetical protein|uniref:hypothetical protein n=1 Tax=Clostridium TaxID=1485 RepID=UPI00028836F5|nr:MULTISPECIES: hypothetical protein [Clostridium]EEH98764.2 hypothetical protein CSBG_02390 [Clostridium sp. 7_2_43FAA]MBU6136254.1 hypothetical protein [Clostridium tertium]MDB1954428.1 hypothetical protein [Clostridium tertium]MDB1960032.1 hypothetical protein [Clostridium tertium]MDB1962789.1 hypothetical protein [Clostridium tertium]
MDNLNNNSNLKSTKKNINKKQKAAMLVSFISLLAICFCLSYFITDYITDPNRDITNAEAQNETVYSENNKYLDNNIYVMLKTNDNIDMAENLINLKSKLDLSENITKEDLSEELSTQGYVLSEWDNNKLVYTRDAAVNTSKFKSDKYYLGEENGFISLFKTDSNGNIIESEKKVYSDSKPLSNLPEIDQNYIKEHKFSFDTKEEALQKLSEMIS